MEVQRVVTVTVLVGNPKPQSRTRQVAERLVTRLLGSERYELSTIDLADHTQELFTWPSETLAALSEQAATSDLLVVASPTYKASYTGLLKAFLDRYPAQGLRGVLAIPVMTGHDRAHSIAPDVHLTPLLLELGATVPVRGFYFVTAEMERIDAAVAQTAREHAAALSRLRAFVENLGRGHDDRVKAAQ